MNVLYSYTVTIKNLVLSQCSGNIFSYADLHIAVGLFLYECSHCKVENIPFIGYGFAGINLLLKSDLKKYNYRHGDRRNYCIRVQFKILFDVFGHKVSSHL